MEGKLSMNLLLFKNVYKFLAKYLINTRDAYNQCLKATAYCRKTQIYERQFS